MKEEDEIKVTVAVIVTENQILSTLKASGVKVKISGGLLFQQHLAYDNQKKDEYELVKNILSEAPKHSLYDFELSVGDPTKYENSYMVPIHITGVPNQNYRNIYSNLINVLREVAFEVVKLSGNSKITGPLGKLLVPNESKKSPLKIVLDGNPDHFLKAYQEKDFKDIKTRFPEFDEQLVEFMTMYNEIGGMLGKMDMQQKMMTDAFAEQGMGGTIGKMYAKKMSEDYGQKLDDNNPFSIDQYQAGSEGKLLDPFAKQYSPYIIGAIHDFNSDEAIEQKKSMNFSLSSLQGGSGTVFPRKNANIELFKFLNRATWVLIQNYIKSLYSYNFELVFETDELDRVPISTFTSGSGMMKNIFYAKMHGTDDYEIAKELYEHAGSNVRVSVFGSSDNTFILDGSSYMNNTGYNFSIVNTLSLNSGKKSKKKKRLRKKITGMPSNDELQSQQIIEAIEANGSFILPTSLAMILSADALLVENSLVISIDQTAAKLYEAQGMKLPDSYLNTKIITFPAYVVFNENVFSKLRSITIEPKPVAVAVASAGAGTPSSKPLVDKAQWFMMGPKEKKEYIKKYGKPNF